MVYQSLTKLKMGYKNLPKLDEFMENIREHGRLVKHEYTYIENYNNFAREYFEILEKNIRLRQTLQLSETILVKENKNETKYNAAYTIDTSNQDTGRAF